MIGTLGKRLVASGLGLPRNLLRKYLEWSTFKDVLSDLRINCVLDVGANRGQFAASLREIGYSDHIVSFEPIREQFAAMAARFENDKRWKGFNVGLGSEDAERTFNVSVVSSEMSSFLNPRDPNWELQPETVEMKKLDSLFETILAQIPTPPRIFLKMDTQGYDVEVIKGAQRCIGRIHGLQSELSVVPIYENMPSYLEALRTYQELGFALTSLTEVARDVRDKNLVELNCVMVRLSHEPIR